MAEIYDFTKYRTNKEIDMFLTDVEVDDDTILCYGCPDCESPAFMMTLDKEILCVECGVAWGDPQ